jgi:hypothetical protein
MMEPTITQNGALYLAQHRVPSQDRDILERLSPKARKERKQRKQQEQFAGLFFWTRFYAGRH